MGAAKRRENTYAKRVMRDKQVLLTRAKSFSVTVSPLGVATQRG